MKKTILALLAAASVPAMAGTTMVPASKGPVVQPAPLDPCAGGITYNHFQVDWIRTDVDGGDVYNGVDLNLEYQFVNPVYFAASYSLQSPDDVWGVTLGLGGHLPLMDNVDFATDLGALLTDGDDGFYVRPHIRAKFGCLEVHAGAKLICLDGENVWEGFGHLYYRVCSPADIGVGISASEDAWTLSVGMRLSF